MQIVLFLPHYQLVYANFDFSSFSLINYILKWYQQQLKMTLTETKMSESYVRIRTFLYKRLSISFPISLVEMLLQHLSSHDLQIGVHSSLTDHPQIEERLYPLPKNYFLHQKKQLLIR